MTVLGGLSRGTCTQANANTAVASSSSSSFGGNRVIPRPYRTWNNRNNNTMVKVEAVAAEPVRETLQRPDAAGRYGRFGGKYVPETLIAALADLEKAYAEAMSDPSFLVSFGARFSWPATKGNPLFDILLLFITEGRMVS